MNPSKLAVALAASLFLVTASAQDKGGPSDPQIAGIVVAANQIDIDAGKLAKSPGTWPRTRAGDSSRARRARCPTSAVCTPR